MYPEHPNTSHPRAAVEVRRPHPLTPAVAAPAPVVAMQPGSVPAVREHLVLPDGRIVAGYAINPVQPEPIVPKPPVSRAAVNIALGGFGFAAVCGGLILLTTFIAALTALITQLIILAAVIFGGIESPSTDLLRLRPQAGDDHGQHPQGCLQAQPLPWLRRHRDCPAQRAEAAHPTHEGGRRRAPTSRNTTATTTRHRDMSSHSVSTQRVGVWSVSRSWGVPSTRHLDNRLTVEVTRVATDGTPNACSALYSAAWRTARSAGYRRAITYTQDGESGASLKAAGWRKIADLPSPGRLERPEPAAVHSRYRKRGTGAVGNRRPQRPATLVPSDETRDKTRSTPSRKRCPECREPITAAATGRPARYCSPACRQRAYRKRTR